MGALQAGFGNLRFVAVRWAARRASKRRRREWLRSRRPRKIRYHDSEWDLIVAHARECRKPPARYVREVSLGVVPKARRNRIEDGIIHHLGRIGNNLNQLSRLAHATGHLGARDEFRSALDEILVLVRRIG